MTCPPHRPCLPAPQTPGFSLIEVVIAIGIVASVLVALLGLLGYGMTTLRESSDTTVQARIVQEIMSKLQAADEAQVKALDVGEFYYDVDGNQFESGTGSSKAIYVADVVVEETVAGSGIALPGADQVTRLRRVTVRVGRFPGGQANWDDATKGERWEDYSTVVARIERERLPGK